MYSNNHSGGGKSILLLTVSLLLVLIVVVSGEECTRCCCRECVLTHWTPHYNGCGGNDHIHTANSGTRIKVYANGCQPCSNGRVLARIIGQKGWAYFPSQFIHCSPTSHCNYYNANDSENMLVEFKSHPIIDETSSDTTGGSCKPNGHYTVKSSATLRDTPSGLVCTNLSPGERVTVTKCNPGSHWCRVHANSPSCRHLKSGYCNGCTGYMMCHSL